jgi:probable Rubsico expression protein CbbX
MNGFGFERTGGLPPAQVSGEAEEDGPPTLSADSELDLSADEMRQKVEETLDRLDAELVGLGPVKRRVREIAALLLVDRARQQFGLTASRPTLHMSFTGGPGTGKTTVATRMAQMLHAMGYIRSPKVHTVTRDDLVGQFIGHTAPKTKEAIAKAAGGILFIDEAYYLFRPENERDYGQEVIEILLQHMEDDRESMVVIFAGYPDRMDTFFGANPGLSSRVPHHIGFEDYSHDELVQIAELMISSENFQFTDNARAAFAEYLDLRMQRPRFSNARSVRNALERSRLRQARRLVDLRRPLNRQDLVTITAEDVRGSSLFEDSVDDDVPEVQGADA